MKRFLKKALRWLGILSATLVVLLLVLYAEEDWRGTRDWAACQRDLAAKGESLDLRQLAPPGKPEDDLSKVPIFAELFQQPPIRWEGLIRQEEPKPTRLDKIDAYLGDKDDKQPVTGNYFKGASTDLGAWQKFYRVLPQAHLPTAEQTPAQDVLQALTQFDPEWNEIESALNNPNAYWSIDYDHPYNDRPEGITSMIRLAKVLPLRAAAHLANNQTNLAEKDFLFSFNLTRPIGRNSNMLGFLVIVGVRAINCEILWEGIHQHAWNNTQLQEMESALASTDLLKLAPDMFRLERAHALQTMKAIHERDPELFKSPIAGVDNGVKDLLRLALVQPSGWWNQDRLHYCLMVQKRIDSLNLAEGTMNPEVFDNKNGDSEKTIWTVIYTPITSIVHGQFNSIGHMIARAETNNRLARLACRLEEYRIAHAQYPDQLADLPDMAPHLNQEVLSDQPLHYQRKGDSYTLYSVGWDQKDDGGVLSTKDPNSEGDWPWPSP